MSEKRVSGLPVHRRRFRKDGSVDFEFRYGTERMKRNIAPASDLDGLQALFEQHVGAKLPEPEVREGMSE